MTLALNSKELRQLLANLNSLRIEYFVRCDQSTVNFHLKNGKN